MLANLGIPRRYILESSERELLTKLRLELSRIYHIVYVSKIASQ